MINSDGLLRVAHLYIMGNEKCRQHHQGKVTLNESELCAGAEKIGSGPCEVKIGCSKRSLSLEADRWIIPVIPELGS